MHFPATPGRAKPKPIVLVIDDEAGSRDALRVILRPFFTIQTADSARAAMEVLHTQPIDLITLDLKLPDRPGLELLHDLTQYHAGVEVIIITGYGSVRSHMEGAAPWHRRLSAQTVQCRRLARPCHSGTRDETAA